MTVPCIASKRRPDQDSAFGFTIGDAPLGPPGSGSIEAAALDAGVDLGLIDLRNARNEYQAGEITSIRSQSGTMNVPVAEAFDSVLVIPAVTKQEGIGI